MTKIYNKTESKKIRQKLRKAPIGAEQKLWQYLRKNQQEYKFRRQYGVGKYILDFYCPRLKLGIEIDGATHSDDMEIKNDKVRENYIKSVGIKILRFTNSDVYKEIDAVVGEINSVCEELSNSK